MAKVKTAWILLATACIMLLFYIIIGLLNIHFVASLHESIYLVMIVAFFLSASIYLLEKGFLKRFIIISLSVIAAFMLLMSSIIQMDPDDIAIHKMKNDSLIVLEDKVSNGFNRWWRVSFGETYFFDLFYKQVGRQYEMSLEAPNENLDTYELPAQYKDHDQYGLFIAEDESLLVDLEKHLCFKVRKKT